MYAGRRQRMIGHRKCCSDMAHDSRHVAPQTAGISVRNQQPADSRQQGNPAPSSTVHGRRDSPVCTGYAAEQVTSAAACRNAGVMCSHRRVPVTRRAAA